MQVKNITAEHVFLACGHTDMRKSIDGLAAIVQQNFKLDPFSKDVFMFCGRHKTLVNAAFSRVLWYNKSILNAGEISVSENSLLEKLSSMRKLLFSSKSERTRIILPNSDQLSLFDEVEQEAAPKPCGETTTVKTHKRKKQRTQKKLDLSKAINYCLSHRNELMNYLRDGNCSISNNLAERSIRPFTIGRKNWVFSGSPAGAEASATAYSLIETCIANKVDTKEYLEYIFTNMSQEDSLKDDAVLEKYLPWNVNLPTEE